MLKKFAAELVGTMVLVLFGCGAAVLGGFDHVGQLGIALAFGFAIIAMAYGIGPVSGCHVNPAVSLGVFVAGRMSAKDMVIYWVAQFIGAIIGAAIGITLAVIHIVGIQVTGVSVNPARSFGPALLVGGQALSQVWVFFVAPAIGAVIGALFFRLKLLEPEA